MLYMAYKSYNAPSGFIWGHQGTISRYPAHEMVESFEREGLHNYPQTAELYELYKKDAARAKQKMILFIAISVLCMLLGGYILFLRKQNKPLNNSHRNNIP